MAAKNRRLRSPKMNRRRGRPSRPSSSYPRLLHFELLEARRVLAGMFAGVGGTGMFLDSINVTDFGRLQDVALGDLDFFQIQKNDDNRLWFNDGTAVFTDSGLRFAPSAGNAGAVGNIDGDGDIDLQVGNSYGRAQVFVNASLPELVDLAVSKAPLGKSLTQGETFTYSITVENPTQSEVIGASFVEALTQNLVGATLISVSTEGGAVSQAVPGAFVGNFSDTLDLPALSSVTYEVSAQVTEAGSPFAPAEQTATSTARVTVPMGQYDSDLTNNVAKQAFVVNFATRGGTASFSNVFASADPPGRNVQALALGDLNGDGFLDAVIGLKSGITTFPDQRDQVWFGNGDGTFQVGVQLLSQVDQTMDVALGDLDGDGDLDAVLLTRDDSGRIWLNDGDGLLVDSGQSLEALHSSGVGSTEPRSVAIGDLDGDGDLDLLFAGETGSTTTWWNDGTGIFTDSGQRLDFGGSDVDLGDVDGDGDLDALTADLLLLNNGQGIFELTRPGFANSSYSGRSFLRDLDGDGDLDAAVISSRGIEIWLNDGSGEFTDTEQEFEAFTIGDAGIADFDNDGDLDFIAAVRFGSNPMNRVWLNDGTANFELLDIGFGDDETRFLAVGDLNNDGAVDYFELNVGYGEQHRVWLNASTDLSIDIAEAPARTSVVEGSTVRYTVTAENLGASVAGATVNILFDPGITQIELLSVTPSDSASSLLSTGSQGRTLVDTIDLPADGSVVYVFEAVVGGPLQSQAAPKATVGLVAQIAPPDGILDGNVGNDSDTERNVLELASVGGTGLLEVSPQLFPNAASYSVALGDLDGDGDLDAYVGRRLSPNEVWINDGDGTFTATGQIFETSTTSDVALGDLDGDGDLDVFEVIPGNDQVLLNDGTGRFTRLDAPVPTTTFEIDRITLADMDGDGDLDAVPGGGRGNLLLNDGTGRFTAAQAGSAISNSYTVNNAVGDLDGDGDLDVVLGNVVHFNRGDGVFVSVSQFSQSIADRYARVALGDIDNDNDLDVIVSGDSTNRVWTNDGTGTFTDSGQSLGGQDANSTALADFDSDGDLDILFDGSELWLNDGAGIFIDSGQSLRTAETRDIAIGDLDGDGDVDGFFVGGAFTTGGVADQVWFNLSGDDFADLTVTNSSGRTSVVEGDTTGYTVVVSNSGPANVVGASIVDLFSTNLEDITLAGVSATGGASGLVPIGGVVDRRFEATVNLPADSSLTFEFTARVASAGQADGASEATVYSSASVSLPPELRELTPSDNRDADSDLVELSATRGNATFGPSGEIFGNVPFAGDIALGDLDGDGDLDAFVGNNGDLPNTIWLNDGLGQMLDTGQQLGTRDAGGVALADLDNDGDLDAISNTGTWRNDGSGGFAPWQGNLVGGNARIVAGDFNGDGWIDVAARSYILFNDGAGNLEIGSQQLPRSLGWPTTGDVDGDGDLDLLGRDGTVELWLNDGNGVFTHANFFIVDGNGVNGIPFLADLDNDGDLDAFFTGAGQPVWLNDGSGQFQPTDQEFQFPGVTDVEFADIDNDGDLDVLMAFENQLANRILINDGAAGFAESDETLGDGWTAALATGDLDGDGDIDALTANSRSGGTGVWLNLDSPAPFDLSVESSSDRTSILPGESVIYTVVVRNNGPRDVAGAEVVNATHGSVAAARVTSIVVDGGASSTIALGPIDGSFRDAVNLPIGSSITYQVEVTAKASLADHSAPEAMIGNGVFISNRLDGNTDLHPGDNRTVDNDVLVISSTTGTGLFTEADNDLGTAFTTEVLLGDLNGDGNLDAVVINSGEPSQIWFGEAGVLVDSGQSLDTGSNSGGELGDLDGDGDLDFIAYVSASSSQSSISVIWLNDGAGNFLPQGPTSHFFRSQKFVLGDLDGDGDLDAMSPTSVWVNDGDANFILLPQQMPSSSSGSVLTLGDIDADGDLDALIAGGSTRVWLNNGIGQFVDSGQRGFAQGDTVVFGDVDGDGDLDALVGRYLLLNNGDGVFVESADLLPAGISYLNVKDSSFGDLDGDGDLDALIADEFGSRAWINDGNGLFTNTFQFLATPNASAVSLGDLDGDGDLDLVTAARNQPTQVWRNLDAREVVDFSIRKTADPDIFRGETISYRIEVRNDGPGDSVALFSDFYDPRLLNINLTNVDLIGGAFTTLSPGPLGHNVNDLLFLPAGATLVLEVSAQSPPARGENLAATMNFTSSASIGTPNRIVDADPTNDVATTLTLAHQGGQASTGILVDSGQRFGSGLVGKVSLGDLDGDGDLDAFVVARGSDQVWLNDGAGNFVQSEQVFDDSNTTDVALGDFDGDGDLDAFLASQREGQQLWLNDGNANFVNANLDLGSAYGLEVIAIDIDGDGDLDAAVNSWPSTSGASWQVWLNDGSGDLSSDSFILANWSRGAALGDLDGDGDADAFVAGLGGFRAVYFGDQPGQPLLGPVRYTDPNDNESNAVKPVALGDFDGDGDLDVFSATNGISQLWMNDGSGTLALGTAFDVTDSREIVSGDLNGDGQLDVVIADRSGISKSYVAGAPTQLLPTGVAWGVALGDLDGDGDLDAFFVETEGAQVWLNTESTDLSVRLDGGTSTPVGETATYVLTVRNDGANVAYTATVESNLADLLQDYQLAQVQTTGGAVGQATPGEEPTGFFDTVFLPAGATIVYTFTGIPGRSPVLAGATEASITWSANVMPIAEGLEDDPSNNSAILSQLLVAPATGGGAKFDVSDDELYRGINTDVQLGDVDADGDLDIILTHRFDGTFLYLNDGIGEFGAPAQQLGNQDTFAAALGDLDGDGDLDVLLGNRLQTLAWLRGNGVALLASPISSNGGAFRTRDILLGDLDGDGDLDAVEINQGDDSRILLGNGFGYFDVVTPLELGTSSVQAALGDLDGDGDLDLFVVSDQQGPEQIWLNDGAGGFMDSGQRLASEYSTGVALGDLDGDGDLDAVVSGGNAPNVAWINDGQGRFSPLWQSSQAGNSAAVALGDFDGDGDLDAVFSSNGAAPSRVALNEGGTFPTYIELQGGYSSNALAIGDLNGDGTLDVVFASNLQSDGRIWFNRDATALGDFNKDGSTDTDDFGIWEAEFGQSGPGVVADANGDLAVNGADFLAWQRGVGQQAVTVLSDGGAMDSGAGFLAWQRGFGAIYSASELVNWEASFGNSPGPITAARVAVSPQQSTFPEERAETMATVSSKSIVAAGLVDAVLALEWMEATTQGEDMPAFDVVAPSEAVRDFTLALPDVAQAKPVTIGTDSPATRSADVEDIDEHWLADELLERVFGQSVVWRIR